VFVTPPVPPTFLCYFSIARFAFFMLLTEASYASPRFIFKTPWDDERPPVVFFDVYTFSFSAVSSR